MKRYEVLVRDRQGEEVVYHLGDATEEAPSAWEARAQADDGVTYLGIAVEGVSDHLWAAGDVEAARDADGWGDLVDRGRALRWRPAVRDVLRGMSPDESLAVYEIAERIDATTTEVRGAVEAEIAAGNAVAIVARRADADNVVRVAPSGGVIVDPPSVARGGRTGSQGLGVRR